MELIKLCRSETVTLDQIKMLVESGVEINYKTIHNETPLLWLCWNESVTLDLIKYMVENGADVNHKNWCGKTPLIWLCENKSVSLDMIKYMLENEADANYKLWDEYTPLYFLCSNRLITLEKKLEIIRYMKKYITDIDKEIEKIVCEDKEEIIEELERVESTSKSAAKR
jgi:ankyrin repeat protein